MIQFSDIDISSKEEIQSYTINSKYRNCDFSFSNLCSWRVLYKTQYAIYKGFLIIRFWNSERMSFLYPIGTGDIKEIIKDLIHFAESIGQEFNMQGVCKEDVDLINKMFEGKVKYESNRSLADYIYNREDLVNLKGKKYQPKRNHINKFKKSYPNYRFEPITEDKIEDCIKLEEEWCKAKNCNENNEKSDERKALTFALNNFKSIGLRGGVLYVENKIVAFTFGTAINQDTFGVNVEKANTDFDGAYSVINNEFAKTIPEQYAYINREEDLGIDGLRKAKLSYYPEILLEKYSVSITL